MSVLAPYIAPWASNFERLSVQLYTPQKLSNDRLHLAVSQGQWWRIIYLTGRYNTSALAVNRSLAAEITDTNNQLVLQQYTPAPCGPNSLMTALFAPGLTAFSDTAVALHEQATAPIPDALWPPGSAIELHAYDVDAPDSWIAPTTFAVEIYVPSRVDPRAQPRDATPLIA